MADRSPAGVIRTYVAASSSVSQASGACAVGGGRATLRPMGAVSAFRWHQVLAAVVQLELAAELHKQDAMAPR